MSTAGESPEPGTLPMRAVLQRVHQASVSIHGSVTAEINRGFLIFLGIASDDTEQDIDYLVSKIINLRAFEDQQGKMNIGLQEAGGSLLVVSQFTLYADCRKGRRPSFTDAARPEQARSLYSRFIDMVRAEGLTVQTGSFQEMMDVALINDGPVTFLLDSRRLF
jgi:D-tyrosyl-tRNA(Tyr) deacylase